MNNLDESLQKFREFLNSEEGKKSLQEFADEINAERDNVKGRCIQTDAYLKTLSTKEFRKLLNRIILENGDSQREYWYKQNIVPMPTQKAQLLFEYMFSEESVAKRLGKKEFMKYETGFGDIMVKYRGYIFHMFFGQGESTYRIIKNDKTIFRY